MEFRATTTCGRVVAGCERARVCVAEQQLCGVTCRVRHDCPAETDFILRTAELAELHKKLSNQFNLIRNGFPTIHLLPAACR